MRRRTRSRSVFTSLRLRKSRLRRRGSELSSSELLSMLTRTPYMTACRLSSLTFVSVRISRKTSTAR